MSAPSTSRLFLALLASAALVAACGGSSLPGAGSSSPATLSPHVGMSRMETAALAAELVPVPGFRYADVPADELSGQLDRLPDTISSASFHGVVDESTGREAAFLALTVPPPGDAMHSQAYAERVAKSALSTDTPSPQIMSGQTVWYAEDSSRPASRYQYTWLRHGTVGWVDGPDRTTVETFLAGYFATGFRGAENKSLAERMVDLDGFSYTNALDQTVERSAVTWVLPDVPSSVHFVFDATHSIGGLVLVGPYTTTDSDLLSAAKEWLLEADGIDQKPMVATADTVVGAIHVHHLAERSGQMHLYVWRWPDTGVGAWFVTSRPDIAPTFLHQYVAASPTA
jgi:hypothetical protein